MPNGSCGCRRKLGRTRTSPTERFRPGRRASSLRATGETITYRELDDRSNRLAQLMWDAGLRRGDHVALFMENHPRYFEVYWAAIRSGLYLTTVSRHLGPEEAAWIIDDCGAKLLVTSAALGDVAQPMLPHIPRCPVCLMVDGTWHGYDAYEEATAAFPARPLAKQPRGETMHYSSGTTGKPKGVWRPLPDLMMDDPYLLPALLGGLFGITEDAVYLSPAPLYHAAPLGFAVVVQSLGGTVVVMETFDAREAL
ncbi:MAG: AMP-binding protein, partial [Planctomycetota bacterium]